MHPKQYFVYLLASERNGTLYIGVTNDLIRRVHEHQQGIADGFTKKHNIKMLVWYEQHTVIEQAIIREKQLKKWNRAWKIELVEKENPLWRDLAGDLWG
jgi:putative endonuclease